MRNGTTCPTYLPGTIFGINTIWESKPFIFNVDSDLQLIDLGHQLVIIRMNKNVAPRTINAFTFGRIIRELLLLCVSRSNQKPVIKYIRSYLLLDNTELLAGYLYLYSLLVRYLQLTLQVYTISSLHCRHDIIIDMSHYSKNMYIILNNILIPKSPVDIKRFNRVFIYQ